LAADVSLTWPGSAHAAEGAPAAPARTPFALALARCAVMLRCTSPVSYAVRAAFKSRDAMAAAGGAGQGTGAGNKGATRRRTDVLLTRHARTRCAQRRRRARNALMGPCCVLERGAGAREVVWRKLRP
jgi:hypothetical protein